MENKFCPLKMLMALVLLVCFLGYGVHSFANSGLDIQISSEEEQELNSHQLNLLGLYGTAYRNVSFLESQKRAYVAELARVPTPPALSMRDTRFGPKLPHSSVYHRHSIAAMNLYADPRITELSSNIEAHKEIKLKIERELSQSGIDIQVLRLRFYLGLKSKELLSEELEQKFSRSLILKSTRSADSSLLPSAHGSR